MNKPKAYVAILMYVNKFQCKANKSKVLTFILTFNYYLCTDFAEMQQ